ncbi:hypothetical protein LCGC14_1786960 [marine sediment metagenome]|uniref:Uncharacterized protein n=1 Tax=marine sediment metagenome TaxID=412755 RepID=A0A0F9HG88_9ZZZZ|nr:hypothetical protein [bacterium]
MKLYGEVSSERATKGQGGNEFVNVIITDQSETVRFKANFIIKGDEVEMHTTGVGVLHRNFALLPKGKKQKGKCPVPSNAQHGQIPCPYEH